MDIRKKAEELGVFNLIQEVPVGGAVELPELLHFYFEKNNRVKDMFYGEGEKQSILTLYLSYRNEKENPFTFTIRLKVVSHPRETLETVRKWFDTQCWGDGHGHGSWRRNEPDYTLLSSVADNLEYFNSEVLDFTHRENVASFI